MISITSLSASTALTGTTPAPNAFPSIYHQYSTVHHKTLEEDKGWQWNIEMMY